MYSKLHPNTNGDDENNSRNGTQLEPHQSHEPKQLNQYHGQKHNLKIDKIIITTCTISRPGCIKLMMSLVIKILYSELQYFLPEKCGALHIKPNPKVIKKILCTTQLSMKFFLLINVKMPTTVGILTLMSKKTSIISLSKPEKKLNFLIRLYL